MRGMIRYIAALLAAVMLLGAALLGLFCLVTTELFARTALGTEVMLAKQQAAIDKTAASLAEAWQLSGQVLAPCAEGAAARQQAATAAWWGALWRDVAADPAMPAYLDAGQERALIAAIMADEGFLAATEEGQRRAIARDEIAYGLDEAVCDAVTPLRRSVAELGFASLAAWLPLPQLRQAALMGAGMLVLAGVLLLLLAHRAAGGTLLATAMMMVLVSIPVWLLNVPGMLKQLNVLAAKQGMSVLGCMGCAWYGAAALLALTGMCIVAVKRVVRRRKM